MSRLLSATIRSVDLLQKREPIFFHHPYLVVMDELFTHNSKTAMEKKEILAICQAVARGSEKARRQLLEILFNRVHITASYLASSLEEAEKLALVAGANVLREAGTFRGESSLMYWADRVTVSTASKILIKKRRRRQNLNAFYQTLKQAKTTEEMTGHAFIRRRLTFHLRDIKYNQREVLLLRYIHGYSMVETAELCCIPVKTARTRLGKGRSALKKKVVADPFLKEWVSGWT